MTHDVRRTTDDGQHHRYGISSPQMRLKKKHKSVKVETEKFTKYLKTTAVLVFATGRKNNVKPFLRSKTKVN